MLDLLFYAVVLFVVVSAVALLTNTKLRNRVASYWNRKTDNAADAFGNIITDHKDAISHAEKDTEQLRSELARAMAKVESFTKDGNNAIAEAAKYGEIAKAEAQLGHTDNVENCVRKRQAAEKRAVAISAENKKNEETIKMLRNQLNERRDQIQTAKANVAISDARWAGIQMRKKMLESSHAFGSSNLDVGSVNQQLDELESEMNHYDELGDGGIKQLEKIYEVDKPVQEEVEKLMAEANRSNKTMPLSH